MSANPAATPWLSPDAVADLTGTNPRSWRTQRQRLAAMGIPFQPNAVGRPLVECDAVLRYRRKPERKPDEPNWKAMA